MKKYLHIILLAVLVVALFLFFFYGKKVNMVQPAIEEENVEVREDTGLYAGISQVIEDNMLKSGIADMDFTVPVLTKEQQAAGIYTFLQGPRSYAEGRPWSGEWCQMRVNWNSFGGFGCGHCCMANIYSSLSPYECSPLDIYHYATQVTKYYPSREGGAIGWRDMRNTLKAAGVSSRLHVKPESYEKFQEHIRNSKSAIVLVSSANDNTFWENTQGHYVNIWLYQEDSDMVFLAEPGDPENNRTWIPLRYVYDALKTASLYQYLCVEEYQEEDNAWKWDGIFDVWNGR